MTEKSGAIRKILGVTFRNRSKGCGQDKPISRIHRGMFFQSIMPACACSHADRVVFQGLFHSQIGEGQGLVQSFESHDFPPIGFFKGEYPLKL